MRRFIVCCLPTAHCSPPLLTVAAFTRHVPANMVQGAPEALGSRARLTKAVLIGTNLIGRTQQMADVFISYSSADKSAADAVCAALEANGTSCCIAPRDIVAGSYAAAIIRGIRASKMLVLIFSSHSNKSPQVEREIERAVSLDKVIYPLRIENVLPSEHLELFISAEQ